VKRLCADDSAATSVKVGYRQASYKEKPTSDLVGFFSSGQIFPPRNASIVPPKSVDSYKGLLPTPIESARAHAHDCFLTQWRVPSREDRNMSSNKQKIHGNNQRTVAQQKLVPVADGSRQARTPGAGPGKKEAITSIGSEQSALGGPEVGERGGPGAQQSGWSSRQQAERMEARAEEARLGLPQQSGYGGAEQNQHAGSQESPTGPPGAWQTGTRQRSGGGGASQSHSGGKQSRQGGSGSKQ
jgi:hypothetical protein